jgi:O-antigen/teichoic acid export membrane protein
LAVTTLFGKQILAVFGPDYIAAYWPMCLFSIGSSVWAIFSLAPSFLIFTQRQRTLFYNLLIHGIVLGVAIAFLFPRYGALGAAASYAVCISSLALSNFAFARRRVGELAIPKTSR